MIPQAFRRTSRLYAWHLIGQVGERPELAAAVKRLAAWIPEDEVGEPDPVLTGQGR